MKNKWFYFLPVFYVAMVVIILYINGVFTGEMTSFSNLLINVGFLVIIGVLFVISCISFARLNRCTDRLVAVTEEMSKAYKSVNHNLWDDYRKKNKVFGDAALDEAFKRYQKSMAKFQTKRGLIGVCDIEDYINGDLIERAGLSYFNSAIAGTMTGLGILGTFIGLSIGLGSFSGDDIYTISDNVGPLLGGMKVAFHTSVYGIFFSLIFTFVYRSIMSDAYDKLQSFIDCFKECAEPVAISKDDTERAMLMYQSGMASTLKQMNELMQGNAMEQVKGVEKIVAQFMAQMEQTMSTDFVRIGKSLEKACEAQTVYAVNFKTLEETANSLLNTNRMLQKTLEESLMRQEALSRELKTQQERIAATCDAVNNEISSQLYTYNLLNQD